MELRIVVYEQVIETIERRGGDEVEEDTDSL